MGGGVGAQRPVWHGNAPKKTGARSARARTRGQNPLVKRESAKLRWTGEGAQLPVLHGNEPNKTDRARECMGS